MHRYSSQLNQSNSFDFIGSYKESTSQFELMRELLTNNRQNEIVDFDDHLIDVNLDWRNNFVDSYIK
jgi:hypothetical protein